MVVSWILCHDAAGQLQHEIGGARVERGGVLVQQQDARGLQRRHQQADRLALAAREQADAVGQPVFQPQAQRGQPIAEQRAHFGLDGAGQLRKLPRHCARAMFSSMVRSSQVPAIGS